MSGKRVVFTIVFSLIFSVIICFLPGGLWPVQAVEAMEGPRVSLLAFGGNAEKEYCQLAANRLVSVLAEDFPFFILVDPQEALLGEEYDEYPITGLLAEAEAVAIGRSLGVDLVLLGHIDRLSYDYPWAEAWVTVKVLEVGSNQYYYISGYGAAGSTDGQTAMRNAVADCFSAHFLAELRRQVAPVSFVSAVEGDFLYFSNGREIGIKEGMQYRIWRQGEADRRTEAGTAEVTEVGKGIAKARIIGAKGEIRASDEFYLEEIPPAPKERPVVAKEGKKEWGLRPSGKKPEKEPEPVRSSRRREVTTFSYTPVLLGKNAPFNLAEIRPRQEGKYGYWGSVLGLGYGKEKDIYINTGFEAGLQLPVIDDFLALTFGGAIGYGFLHRGPHDEFFRSQNLSSGFYCSFNTGLKFYIFGYDGLRLEYDKINHTGPRGFFLKGHRISLGIKF